jgi:uncharacterized membrane protein YqaE (UPF0057 family)
MKDRILLGGLVLAFALFLTFQIATVFGLAKRPPRVRALLSVVLPPVAVYYAYREGFRVRAIGLGISLLAYLLLRVLSVF